MKACPHENGDGDGNLQLQAEKLKQDRYKYKDFFINSEFIVSIFKESFIFKQVKKSVF